MGTDPAIDHCLSEKYNENTGVRATSGSDSVVLRSRVLSRVLWGGGLLVSFSAYSGLLYHSASVEARLADFEVALPVFTMLVLKVRPLFVGLGTLLFLISLPVFFVARTKQWPEVLIAAMCAFFVLGTLITVLSVIVPASHLPEILEAEP